MSRVIFEPLPDDEEAIEAIRQHLLTKSSYPTRTDVIRFGLHAAMRELRPIEHLAPVLKRTAAEE